MGINEHLERMLLRAETLMARIESVLPQALHAPDWKASIAFRYRKRNNGHGVLEPVKHVASLSLDDLKEIDAQKKRFNAILCNLFKACRQTMYCSQERVAQENPL